MIIIPAIDIKGSRVVRLTRGEFGSEKVYSDDPADVALRWKEAGANLIHVVDLDGAMTGIPDNLESLEKILDLPDVDIEFGGGLRDEKMIERVVKMGVKRPVVGTRACEDFELIKRLVNKYHDRLVISIDALKGVVKTSGWIRKTTLKAVDLAVRLSDMGVKNIVYTDISRDGTLEGPNFEDLEKFLSAARGVSVIASGGVSSIDDVKMYGQYEKSGLYGVIIGKALYEGKVDLKEALGLC
jgi:phosphoribosylformimino-5-aminoimidazole carboxamide ribotide isomerase